MSVSKTGSTLEYVKDVRSWRRTRLEAMLLGYALAVSGDREKVLKEVNPRMLQSELVGGALEGVKDGDSDKVRESLSQWMICGGETILDGLIKRLDAYDLEDRLVEELDLLLGRKSIDGDFEDIQKRLTASLGAVTEHLSKGN